MLNSPSTKTPVSKSSYVSTTNTLLNALLSVLATEHEDLIQEVGHTQAGCERYNVSYIDTLGRAVKVQVYIKEALHLNDRRFAVRYPMTYKDYNSFTCDLLKTLPENTSSAFLDFFNGCMAINRNEHLFDCVCDCGDNSTCLSLVLEDKSRSFSISTEVQIDPAQ